MGYYAIVLSILYVHYDRIITFAVYTCTTFILVCVCTKSVSMCILPEWIEEGEEEREGVEELRKRERERDCKEMDRVGSLHAAYYYMYMYMHMHTCTCIWMDVYVNLLNF